MGLFIALVLCCSPSFAVTFTNQTNTLAPGTVGQRIAWGDYNDDGYVDFLVGNWVHRNNGPDLTTPGAWLPFTSVYGDTTVGLDGLWGDYNNDGRLDIYDYGTNRLFGNTGGDSFAEVTMPALTSTQRFSASWADYDNNGFLDIHVTGGGATRQPDATLLNNNGTFTAYPNVTNGNSRGVTNCDFDRDGDQDIYVSHYWLDPNFLWLNDGNAAFSEVASEYGNIQGNYTPGDDYYYGHTGGSAFGDFDNDGNMDLFVNNLRHPWGDGTQDYSTFYRNLGAAGDYHFTKVQEFDGADWVEGYSTPAMADYDNDGDLDLFVGVWANYGNFCRLYRNDGNFNFTNVTAEVGLSTLNGAYGAAWADFDNDGDMDLIAQGRLLVNTVDNSNHWIKVHLTGDEAATINRAAIGSEVRISVDHDNNPATADIIITRQVEGGMGIGNQNDLTLHFGLGAYSGLVDLEITWANGISMTVEDVAVDETYSYQYMPGDFDGDFDVDGVDFILWQTGYPTASGATLGDGDADGDGDVDGVDFGIWQVNYPTATPASAPQATPEPATLLVLALASLGMIIRRRR